MDKKEYDRLRYLAMKEKKLKQVKDYYKANKEKVKEYQKEYNKDNKEYIAKRQSDYQKKEYKKDPDKFHKRNHKWRNANPEKVKEYVESESYKKMAKISRWKFHGIIWDDYDIIHKLYMKATNCDYCNKEFKDSLDRHCDHDHAITDANNIRGFLCRECNTKDVLKGYHIMELSTN